MSNLKVLFKSAVTKFTFHSATLHACTIKRGEFGPLHQIVIKILQYDTLGYRLLASLEHTEGAFISGQGHK